MSDRLKTLHEKRRKLLADMRGLTDKAEAESRDLSEEERTQFDTMFDDAEKLREDIEREQRLQEEERKATEREARDLPPDDDVDDARDGKDAEKREARIHECFERYLRTGRVYGEGSEELRALSAEIDTEGGFTVAPEMFVNRLIKFVDDAVYLRQWATTFTVSMAQSMGVPTLDTDPADADWTSELATGNEDSDMAFGKRALHPHPVAKRIKISNKLIRMSALSIEQFVRERLGYKFGVTHEKAFLTGDGSQKPLGIFTASSDGISTGRDVSTGNTTTSIQTDGLIEAKYTLKPQYWNNARWLFHRDGVKQIAKLKDGEGQYLWRESVRAGEPDMLLGRPVFMSEFAPNTFTTGLYVGMLADFSHYWIADALSMQIQRLVELYAETNQVGFIGRLETDGMPVLEEAFVRVKLG